MNITMNPAMSVHTMLMAILLWPTVSITSGSVGFAGSFTGTSLAVPVVAPVGSFRGAAAASGAWAWTIVRTPTPIAVASSTPIANDRSSLLRLGIEKALRPVSRQ